MKYVHSQYVWAWFQYCDSVFTSIGICRFVYKTYHGHLTEFTSTHKAIVEFM